MTWTPEIVRIRFIEAADTERFLPRPMTATGKGFWPQHLYDGDDREGWDDAARADHQAKPAARAPAAAITKHAECMDWTSTRIHDHNRRHLVWGYAFCRAHKRDFSKLCDRRGWVKRTAYDRLNRLWDRLAAELCKDNVPLREPSDFWLAHEGADKAPNASTMGRIVQAGTAVPFSPSYFTEKPRDMIRTGQDAETFANWLTERNRREARRREKLGLDAA